MTPKSKPYPRMGLSPRLRGNVSRIKLEADGIGSIPALAGERLVKLTRQLTNEVYPRACGGTEQSSVRMEQSLGLSPRLRGNARPAAADESGIGSIPALAGERRGQCNCDWRLWVYPRACGGTPSWCVFGSRLEGLSPRLRGNAQRIVVS